MTFDLTSYLVLDTASLQFNQISKYIPMLIWSKDLIHLEVYL